MTDGGALERAILMHPEEDMPRLMYCDWLRENVATVECVKCEGDGSPILRRTNLGPFGKNVPVRDQNVKCSACSGRGVVSNRFEERAELIEMGLELAGIPVSPIEHDKRCKPPLGDARCKWCDWLETYKNEPSLRARKAELIAFGRTAGWWTIDGENPHRVEPDGSILWLPYMDVDRRITGTVSRGFVSEISLPSAAFTEELARAVFERFPVTSVKITDKVLDDIGFEFCWVRSREDLVLTSGLVEDAIFDKLEGGRKEKAGGDWLTRFGHEDEWVIYPTRELALEALSRAATDWGRSLVRWGDVTLPPLYAKADSQIETLTRGH